LTVQAASNIARTCMVVSSGMCIPRRTISARFAPLPPSKPRTASQSPPTYDSAWSISSKRYTHFFSFSHLPNTPLF
jgi:hypothetical protein